MARLARILIPNIPHHITQRGNRRQQTFFCDDDYAYYINLLFETCKAFGVRIDGYCLMPNHVHLILTPQDEEGIRVAVSEVHRTFTRRMNLNINSKGHFWQGRFFSCPMDERYFQIAMRYVEQNPVRAGLVQSASTYRWSSAFAVSAGTEQENIDEEKEVNMLRLFTRTGRPLGDERFLTLVSKISGRSFDRKQPGPKKKNSLG